MWSYESTSEWDIAGAAYVEIAKIALIHTRARYGVDANDLEAMRAERAAIQQKIEGKNHE